jgi:hypothetical protein
VFHYEAEALIAAPQARVFAYVDDQSRLSSHMSKSSWMMGGGRMEISFDADRGQKVGSRIRLSGKAFGTAVSVDEIVTMREMVRRRDAARRATAC